MRRGTISCSPLKKNLPRQNIKLNVKSRVREAQRKIESAFEERYISLETQRSGKQGAHHIPSWNSSSCALDSVTTEREKKRRRREREREKLSIFLVLCALVISFTYTFLSFDIFRELKRDQSSFLSLFTIARLNRSRIFVAKASTSRGRCRRRRKIVSFFLRAFKIIHYLGTF